MADREATALGPAQLEVAATSARGVAMALLAGRAPEATLCPSEVARALAAEGGADSSAWRDMMPVVHAAVDSLLSEGLVRLSWKGRVLQKRAGPYRIGRNTHD